MSKLLILSRDSDEYAQLVQQANLPNLEIVRSLRTNSLSLFASNPIRLYTRASHQITLSSYV